ncbi:trypsin 3A1-like [Sergentomyia squamirostris]
MASVLLTILLLMTIQYSNASSCSRQNVEPECDDNDMDCGILPENFPMITGGYEAKEKRPWYVALTTDGKKWPQCAGALINQHNVLTAAHCFLPGKDEEYWKTEYQIWVGVYKWEAEAPPSEDAQRVYADQVILHENYSPFNHNTSEEKVPINYDIAIIRLTSRARKMPICLPNKKLPLPPNGVIVGYGYINKGGAYPENLMQVNISLYSAERCKEMDQIMKNYEVKKDLICALGESGNGYCGDSGGVVEVN